MARKDCGAAWILEKKNWFRKLINNCVWIDENWLTYKTLGIQIRIQYPSTIAVVKMTELNSKSSKLLSAVVE